MKRAWRPHISAPAAVQPIPPHLARIINGPSSSTAPEVGYATPDLWARLEQKDRDGDNDGVAGKGRMVAVAWPKERRLKVDKGKAKEGEDALILLVKPLPEEAAGSLSTPKTLYIPAHLLPPYSAPPLSVTVHRHTAVSLSSIVLQAVQDTDDELDTSSIELSAVRAYLVRRIPALNGPSILREGDTITIPLDRADISFRILMLEPVCQGVPTAGTQLILSSEPYVPRYGDDGEYMEDGDDARSSYARTHLSLSDFDPDAFLSGSLSLQSRSDADDDGASTTRGEWYPNGTSSEHSTETSGSTTPRALRPASPAAPVREVLHDGLSNGVGADNLDEPDMGARFTSVSAAGPSAHAATSTLSKSSLASGEDDERDVCWVGVGGLGRAGIFEGDWVILRSTSDAGSGRLVKVLAWERLDDEDSNDSLGLPYNPILVPPAIYRSLTTLSRSTTPAVDQIDVTLTPTSFGSRTPALPVAKSMTIARIATTEGLDKAYERAWIRGLKAYFASAAKGRGADVVGEANGRLVRRGDIFVVPISRSRPITADDPLSDSESDCSDDDTGFAAHTRGMSSRQGAGGEGAAVAWFIITSLSFEPLVPIEEDFRSSASSKARAGELGCWADVGDEGETKVVLAGVERARLGGRARERRWYGIPSLPPPASAHAATKLRDLLSSALSPAFASMMHLSILLKGARGAGKRSLLSHIADDLGYNVIEVDCYEITSDTSLTATHLQTRLAKTRAASPSILLLHHIEALSKKSEAATSGRQSGIVKTLQDAVEYMRESGKETGWSTVLIGTVAEMGDVEDGVGAVFKQEIEIGVSTNQAAHVFRGGGVGRADKEAPNEAARTLIATHLASKYRVAPDVSIKSIATQTAALHAGDLRALFAKAHDLAVRRAVKAATADPESQPTLRDVSLAGISLTETDMTSSLALARSSYSDSIGAPKIPNVSWDDVGGLAYVKAEILDTIQLPLSHPELFASGIKKRSGILLYGPPGTGKTLLAKAVATSCGLNFFSVKGPELLNMYIGESEANVRRVFQKAREASPCVIFMDELDSVAPKRGNQGDSGGVMDRIVSQLLAELDGMGGPSASAGDGTGSCTGGGGQGGEKPMVFVMGATNRPDLLDPALLRPGRFDRLVYLSPPTTRTEQAGILRALTRKFDLHEQTDIDAVVEGCGFNMTGADFYALASDAMLGAMGRVAGEVDKRIEQLESARQAYRELGLQQEGAMLPWEGDFKVHPSEWPDPLTPQYYLAALATSDEIKVKVNKEDFEAALGRLRPSVSEDEMRHYERVQRGFRVGDGKVDGRQGLQEGQTEGDSRSWSGKGRGKGKGKEGEGEMDGEENERGVDAWVGKKMDVKGKGKARAPPVENGESHDTDR